MLILNIFNCVWNLTLQPIKEFYINFQWQGPVVCHIILLHYDPMWAKKVFGEDKVKIFPGGDKTRECHKDEAQET